MSEREWTPAGGNDFDPNWFMENEFGDGFVTTSVGGVRVHTFQTTGQAYNWSQTSDEIHDGDVLAVPGEGVWGVLNAAWPVAVVGGPGEFHQMAPGYTVETIEGGRYADAAEVARRLSGERGE